MTTYVQEHEELKRENIRLRGMADTLANMYAEASKERYRLRAELERLKKVAAFLEREAMDNAADTLYWEEQFKT